MPVEYLIKANKYKYMWFVARLLTCRPQFQFTTSYNGIFITNRLYKFETCSNEIKTFRRPLMP